MDIKFRTSSTAAPHKGRLLYIEEDYAFYFKLAEPNENNIEDCDYGNSSLAIDTLQLKITLETQRVISVWGYFPFRFKAIQRELPEPIRNPGGLWAIGDLDLIPGVSYRLENIDLKTFSHDFSTGWICIGEINRDEGGQFVEFADNSIAVIRDGFLTALWLHPEIVQKFE